jgi:hypothetical protein
MAGLLQRVFVEALMHESPFYTIISSLKLTPSHNTTTNANNTTTNDKNHTTTRTILQGHNDDTQQYGDDTEQYDNQHVCRRTKTRRNL